MNRRTNDDATTALSPARVRQRSAPPPQDIRTSSASHRGLRILARRPPASPKPVP